MRLGVSARATTDFHLPRQAGCDSTATAIAHGIRMDQAMDLRATSLLTSTSGLRSPPAQK